MFSPVLSTGSAVSELIGEKSGLIQIIGLNAVAYPGVFDRGSVTPLTFHRIKVDGERADSMGLSLPAI